MGKKALILANSGSGLYDFRGGLITRLKDAGYEVLCALPDADAVKELRALGAKVVRTPMNRRGMNPVEDVKLYRGYRALLKKERPDIVLTYTIKPNIYGGYACRKEGIPYIATVTGLGSVFQSESEGTGTLTHFSEKRVCVPVPLTHLQRLVTAMYRTALKDCKCLFFQNANNRAVFERFSIPSGKTKLVNGSGVDLKRHMPEDYPGHTQETTQFLYVGRLMKEKGSIELLRALRRLVNEYPERAHLTCVGYMEDESSADAQEIAALARQAEEDNLLTRLPYDKEIHAHYAKADAVVMPSYHEGMSNVLMEASATARCVLASDIPGCKEIVEDTVTGFLFPARDEDALFYAMEKFLKLLVAERRMMGRAARRKMECEFDREQIMDAYMEEIL
ncbi:MAG: glycosyltransferase family 4 protein [Lachnospiraceae bacterium]|nr:glycosyltransferase family 4 protein [Lachnospiraceae bacterium]